MPVKENREWVKNEQRIKLVKCHECGKVGHLEIEDLCYYYDNSYPDSATILMSPRGPLDFCSYDCVVEFFRKQNG